VLRLRLLLGLGSGDDCSLWDQSVPIQLDGRSVVYAVTVNYLYRVRLGIGIGLVVGLRIGLGLGIRILQAIYLLRRKLHCAPIGLYKNRKKSRNIHQQ